MKSKHDFQDLENYLEYIKVEAAKSALCVLLTQDRWQDYKEVCKEAHLIGEAFIKTLKIKQ